MIFNKCAFLVISVIILNSCRSTTDDKNIKPISPTPDPDISTRVYTITTSLVNKNIDISTAIGTDGTNIILAPATTAKSQKFIFRKSSEHGYFIIKSWQDTTKVLTVRNNVLTNGTPIEIRTNSNADSQQWMLYNLGNEGFSFSPKNAPELMMEIKDGLTADNTPIIIGTKQQHFKQQFKLNKVN
ncbi:RICIN domain-containing protein [Elizabethkingia ursingii]|uniref:RICIN domain-containing protein n=1 Tax=Elizabethkingia ursingii TaxID=1756150 RepID=UPI00099959FB|nr:RICIN domain-containing protein [Elizabethkingia ursingii]